MKYLILGSSGQVGSNLTQYIRENSPNDTAIEFDIVRSETEDLRIYYNEKLANKIYEADFIFFLAWDVGGSVYLKKYQNTFDFLNNNLLILQNTFKYLKGTKKPFLFASSQMANMSHSAYGLTKSLGELMTKCLGGLLVKFWNVYGIEKDLNKSHVITDLILKAKKNNRIELLSSGKEERQFLYAEDCSRCLLELAKRYYDIDRTKNLHITNFEWTSVLDVAKIISEELGGVDVIPSNEEDTVQCGIRNEPDDYILKFWKPQISLRDGIKRIIKYYEV